ncbi:MAG: LapA family protein [Methylocella sp.]
MKTFLKLLFLIPIIVVAGAAALANRQLVTIFFDPFPDSSASGPQIEAPLFLVLFAALMIGVFIGGVATWIEQGKNRRDARRTRAELRRLSAERARLGLQPSSGNRTNG